MRREQQVVDLLQVVDRLQVVDLLLVVVEDPLLVDLPLVGMVDLLQVVLVVDRRCHRRFRKVVVVSRRQVLPRLLMGLGQELLGQELLGQELLVLC